eukprot:11522176-Ditylum_brightwellii.AAC.1
MEVDEFEEYELGNYSMEVLILAVQATYCPNLLGDGFNHFFDLHGGPGDKWLLKDSLKTAPYMI